MVYERDRGLYKLFGKLFLQVIWQTVQKYYLSHRATDDSAPLYKLKKKLHTSWSEKISLKNVFCK